MPGAVNGQHWCRAKRRTRRILTSSRRKADPRRIGGGGRYGAVLSASMALRLVRFRTSSTSPSVLHHAGDGSRALLLGIRKGNGRAAGKVVCYDQSRQASNCYAAWFAAMLLLHTALAMISAPGIARGRHAPLLYRCQWGPRRRRTAAGTPFATHAIWYQPSRSSACPARQSVPFSAVPYHSSNLLPIMRKQVAIVQARDTAGRYPVRLMRASGCAEFRRT